MRLEPSAMAQGGYGGPGQLKLGLCKSDYSAPPTLLLCFPLQVTSTRQNIMSTGIHDIPAEVLLKITRYLTIQSIRRLKLTSRYLNEVISGNEWTVYHDAALNHAYVVDEKLSLSEAKIQNSRYPIGDPECATWAEYCEWHTSAVRKSGPFSSHLHSSVPITKSFCTQVVSVLSWTRSGLGLRRWTNAMTRRKGIARKAATSTISKSTSSAACCSPRAEAKRADQRSQ